MKLGMIGLGKMGGGMARRLLRHGHDLVLFDLDHDSARAVGGADNTEIAESIEQLVSMLEPPRVAWIMVPAGAPTEQTIQQIAPMLSPGDVLVDGGNSRYTDTLRRHDELARGRVDLVDAGTSGGVHGEREGYCLMVGGTDEAIERVRPLFESLAPRPDSGWAHVGPPGSGHFVKMVHNGIEYGMMQAIAEGFAIMHEKENLAPDLERIARVWQEGSVIRSWLLDLVATLMSEDQDLEQLSPWVSDSGEGRWTVAEAIDLDVPAPVITLSLIQRLRSRDETSYADRLLAGLRNQFGGHAVKKRD